MINLPKIEETALLGKGVSIEEAREVAALPEGDLFTLLAVTDRVRSHFKGDSVNLCSIVSAKSGLCREDCTFCSQSARYSTDAPEFPMVGAGEIAEAARWAEKAGANEFSIVTSGTSIDKERDVSTLSEALREMESSTSLESCASLGIMKRDTLRKLKEAGLKSYHHNLETSRTFFPKVCTTHSYDDDVETVREAKALGFYVCSGGIFGLGETWEDRIELAGTLRDLDVDSVPINLLDPREGTPLAASRNLTPKECLRIIALFRLMMPKKDIIVCGGREVNLRHLQPMIFAAGANGMMLGNYLTTKGRSAEDDLQMLADLGLTTTREATTNETGV